MITCYICRFVLLLNKCYHWKVMPPVLPESLEVPVVVLYAGFRGDSHNFCKLPCSAD